MTVSTSISKSGPYAGAGTTGPFPITFRFLDNTHLRVIKTDADGNETVLALTTDYSVTGAGNDSGGSLTTVASVASGSSLTILRDVPATQLTDYTQSDRFPAESHEQALDKLTMLVQQIGEQAGRAIVFPASESVDPELPKAESRALRVLGFDSSGDIALLTRTDDGGSALALDLLNSTDLTKGSGMVGYKPNYIGSIGRLLSLKLEEWVSVTDFSGVDPTGVGDSTNGLKAGLAHALLTGAVLHMVPGDYLISDTLRPGSGVRWEGSNGRLTGGSRHTRLFTASALDPMIDTSAMKYGRIAGFNVDGGGVAVRGIHGTNVFNAEISNVRVEAVTQDGFGLLNDGTGIGCYGNRYDNCAASDCGNAGFKIDAAASDINLIVHDTCVATDCAYGFLETGTFGGRANQYLHCDAERCSIRGIEVNSTNFRIVGGYQEFNNTCILVDNANIVEQQGGYIGGVSFLGSFGFVGAPNAYQTVGVNINAAYNVTIDTCWWAYCKKGITIASTSRFTEVRNPFYNPSNVETFIEDFTGIGTATTRGGQRSRRVQGSANNIVATPEYGELIYADIGNNNRTLLLDISKYWLGEGHEVLTLMSAVNTGTLTISDSTGATFFGQFGNTRQNNTASLVLRIGDCVELRKLSATSWFVKSSNAVN